MALNPAPIQEPINEGGVVSRMWAQWLFLLKVNLNVAPSYTVSQLPSTSEVGRMVFVSNETGGAVIAFFDGSNWRRVTDRAIVS